MSTCPGGGQGFDACGTRAATQGPHRHAKHKRVHRPTPSARTRVSRQGGEGGRQRLRKDVPPGQKISLAESRGTRCGGRKGTYTQQGLLLSLPGTARQHCVRVHEREEKVRTRPVELAVLCFGLVSFFALRSRLWRRQAGCAGPSSEPPKPELAHHLAHGKSHTCQALGRPFIHPHRGPACCGPGACRRLSPMPGGGGGIQAHKRLLLCV